MKSVDTEAHMHISDTGALYKCSYLLTYLFASLLTDKRIRL